MTATKINGKPARVLVIDDEPALLDIYSTKLRLDGFEVITASDGVLGFTAATHESPDIVLLDVLMPKIDGFEVLRDLRGNPKTKDLPIIILSNLGQEYEVKRGMSLGADRFLTKADLTPSKVSDAVNGLLVEKLQAKG